MPTWLIVLLVVVLALPGVVVLLAGVVAMFVAPGDYDRRRKWADEGRCAYCGGEIGAASTCMECGRNVVVIQPPEVGDDGKA